MKPYLIILYLISLAILGASADALNTTGMVKLGHTLAAIEVGALLVCAPLFKIQTKDIIPFLLSYVCFRVVFFDYSYNLVAGLPLGYNGESSLWDSFLSQFPYHGILFARAVILLVGVSIPFKFIR